MVSALLTSAGKSVSIAFQQKGAWTKALVLFVITALSLSIPTATSEPTTYASNITDFGASNRIAPLVMNVKQSFRALKDTKRTTSIRANVGISRTTDAGGSSLGVCYHGVGDKPSECAQVESGSTGCLVAGKTATVTHRVAKGFVNRQIEIHANRNALCIGFVGFSGQDTSGFQHKCLFIGNVETMDYVNTYSFAVEEFWSRKDMPQTNPECDQYDSNFDDGKDAPRKKKYISEEVHRANPLVNPNYAGKPVVNGTVEIETDCA
ncbi:hypothetical protein BGZ89_003278 [Linnemannia elongata]|nr:hypothetical protein BGZ89_003278 [Linnemannia elongata]